jgi:hypothetical protein
VFGAILRFVLEPIPLGPSPIGRRHVCCVVGPSGLASLGRVWMQRADACVNCCARFRGAKSVICMTWLCACVRRCGVARMWLCRSVACEGRGLCWLQHSTTAALAGRCRRLCLVDMSIRHTEAQALWRRVRERGCLDTPVQFVCNSYHTTLHKRTEQESKHAGGRGCAGFSSIPSPGRLEPSTFRPVRIIFAKQCY